MSTEIRKIGNIGNYYGGLHIKEENGRHYWSIENYDDHHWKEIPKKLYDALVEYQDEIDGPAQDEIARLQAEIDRLTQQIKPASTEK